MVEPCVTATPGATSALASLMRLRRIMPGIGFGRAYAQASSVVVTGVAGVPLRLAGGLPETVTVL